MPHIHEKIDFTAEVYVIHKNRVLLRIHDKHGIWLSVGGHVELDEDPNQAAVREVKEEVGLDITLVGKDDVPNITQNDGSLELIPPRFMNRHRISETHEHVTLVYFARTQNDLLKNEGRESSRGLRWFTFNELEKIKLLPRVRFYAETALKELAD